MKNLPDFITRWIESWNLLSQEWRALIAIGALVLMTAAVAFVVSRVVVRLERRAERSRNLWDDALLHALRRPALGLVWLQGIYWAADIAHHYSEAALFQANNTLLKLGIIVLVVWTLWGFIRQTEKIMVSPLKMERPMDYTTVSAVSKLARAVVVIVAILTAMQSLGFSISGVLAFGGVGGIAVGFAAKDLLANFFGGFMIHLDRPFKIGDWVKSPEKQIEGVVEHIGWRLTTIRTFDQRPLYVPNAFFTTISVENPSRMVARRIYETVGVRYVDVAHMASIVESIREMLRNHRDIDQDQLTIVNFDRFNASSLDIMVYTFTTNLAWADYQATKQDLLLRISDIIAEHGAEVAFPTRTLHVADPVRLRSAGPDANGSPQPPEPAARAQEPEHQGPGAQFARPKTDGEA
ncbi:MscS family membrane protein [Tamilnaduibacter salinus]|uniref:MscS family membrane protein n=1 Tax=Tamilnaduibacter salinus TaxID=1484056 RepID=A0A2U1CVF2_9GAMM|nr:mechanosensitive ion channel family protein [Tamilnaduibacter salinus]PVY75456.1 MscS family membrane protein [Tamilnaduibacter salinus]